MSTISEDEKQARIAELKKIPQKVQLAALFAFALGVVTFLRVLGRAYATQLPIGKGVFYGFLLAFWFFVASGSLYSRSLWGFLGLLALTIFPLLGLFTLLVHLLRLIWVCRFRIICPEIFHSLYIYV